MTNTAHLAASERRPLCEMCGRERAWPPGLYCTACLAYMADCEAEVGSER